MALAVTLAASAAHGQTSVDVEGEHARGMQAREAHRDQEAFDIFHALYERTHEPRALARMALAEGALARWVEAERHLVEALGQTTDPWITQSRAGLDAQLATMRTHLANLEVSSNAPSARWSLDGTEMPPLPLARPVRVAEGPHVIDVSAPGYDAVRRSVTVPGAPDGLTRELVNLVHTLTPAAPPRIVAEPTAAPALIARTTTAMTSEGSGWRMAAVTSFVLGGVGLGVGVAGLVLRNGQVDDFTQRSCWLQGEMPMGAPTCNDIYTSGSTLQALSVASFIVGGVGVAAGAVMLLVAPGAASRESAWNCGRGPGTVGLACGGRF